MVDLTWRQVLDFVERRTPGGIADLEPPAPERIDQLLEFCESSLDYPVPPVVSEVFQTLGAGDRRAPSFFGARYSVNLSEMLGDTDAQVFGRRFFRVAVNIVDDGMSFEEIYVDCAQSNGYDAPVIDIENEWLGDAPGPDGHTIISKSTERAFMDFELSKCGFLGYAATNRTSMVNSGNAWTAYAEAVTDLAAKMGLETVLRPRDALQCYSSSDRSMMFDVIGPGFRDPGLMVKVWLGAKDRRDFRLFAEQLRDRAPPLPLLDEWTRHDPTSRANEI